MGQIERAGRAGGARHIFFSASKKPSGASQTASGRSRDPPEKENHLRGFSWGGGDAGSRTRRSLPARRAISPRAGVVRRDARVADGGARDRPRQGRRRAVVSAVPALFVSEPWDGRQWLWGGRGRGGARGVARAGGRTVRSRLPERTRSARKTCGSNRGRMGGGAFGSRSASRRGNPPPGCPMLGAVKKNGSQRCWIERPRRRARVRLDHAPGGNRSSGSGRR